MSTQAILSAATPDYITDTGGSPNRLLYTLFVGSTGATSAPPPPPDNTHAVPRRRNR